MKKTLITIASVAILSGAANAQTWNLQLSGDAGGWSSGDIVAFNSVSDLLNNNNGSLVRNTTLGWQRDLGEGFGWRIYEPTGAVHSDNGNSTFGGPVINHGNATWAAGNIADFSYNEVLSSFNIQLNGGAGGWSSGDIVAFDSVSDLLNNTNGSLVRNIALGWQRDLGEGFGWRIYESTGALHSDNGNSIFGGPSINHGNVTWAAGNIADFSYNEIVPEPSSTALLCLGSIGFLARRKRS